VHRRREEQPEELRILVHHSQQRELVQRLTRRRALLAGGAGVLGLLAGCGGSTSSEGGGGGGGGGGGETQAAQPPTSADAPIEDRLLISSWVDYSDPANYRAFTRENGPRVTVSGYGSNEEMLARLRAGGSAFDIVAPTGYAVATMIQQDLAMPLTPELIPNMGNIQPAFRDPSFDPGNAHSVPKDYGITSFYWRTEVIRDQPRTLMDCFEVIEQNPDARVNFLEGGTQVVAIALKALGYSLNSEDEGELEEASRLLQRVRPNVDTINSTFIDRASRGQIDFGMGWNGDVRRAIVERRRRDDEMVFLVPEDSTEYWVDNWVIPRDSEHPVAAHRWINMMLEPEPAAREMEYHAYPVPVLGIERFVDEELASDPIIAIPDETIQRYETQLQTPRGQRQRDRIYTEFRAA